MKTYHICFALCEELCTGINVKAKTYMEALREFTKKHGDKNILYVQAIAEV